MSALELFKLIKVIFEVLRTLEIEVEKAKDDDGKVDADEVMVIVSKVFSTIINTLTKI